MNMHDDHNGRGCLLQKMPFKEILLEIYDHGSEGSIVRSAQISDIFQNETQISFLNLAGGGSCSTFWPSVVGNLNFGSFPARPTSRPPHTSPIKHMASAGTVAYLEIFQPTLRQKSENT